MSRVGGVVLKRYPAMVACDTTGVERVETECVCPTYAGNGGRCLTWEPGENGRCAYCDHTEGCHQVPIAR